MREPTNAERAYAAIEAAYDLDIEAAAKAYREAEDAAQKAYRAAARKAWEARLEALAALREVPDAG